jgi:LmbE family N-acetylglucosaminyl deacetylase
MSESGNHRGADTSIAVLSPHLDDAVLSCWHVLEWSAEVTVVNVFSGSPPAGTPAPWWDRVTGATDPVARMRERHEEDRRALALAGRDAVALGLLDDQYRHEEPPLATLVERLRGVLPTGALVYAPMAMGGHPDHLLVRDAAIELARDGSRLVLYADLPHAIKQGWPAWVTGRQGAQPGFDVGDAWADALAGAGLAVERLVPRVRPLDDATRARKLEALALYETQRAALDGLAFAPLDVPEALAWEVSWLVPASALDCPQEPGGETLVADVGGKPLDDRR